MTSPKIEKLRFENVSFKFEGQDAVFENVDFDFPMNQMVWVKAEHGSGRSTLLQILAALQLPTKGNYFINDANIGEMSFEEFLPYRLSIGYGFDMGGLIHNRTLFENLILPLNYHKVLAVPEATERVMSYLREFNLIKYKDQRPSFMPGSARKLACLLRAVILHPQMVLLDDPTVGLPQDTALKFFDLLEALRKQAGLKHLFISSFDEKFMGLIENTEIFIEGGQLHALPAMEDKKVVSL